MAPINENIGSDGGNSSDDSAGQPPPGVTPDLDNPPNQNSLVRTVIIVAIILISILVLLRGYGRLRMKKFTFADILGLIALVYLLHSEWSIFSQSARILTCYN
ncbi:hypothetical protein F4777DRAFT_445596 [Nemania sp. FL0916]|nr:hypothetical protein F4777DRAFT_445596 [Nemania sp. FL0916]